LALELVSGVLTVAKTKFDIVTQKLSAASAAETLFVWSKLVDTTHDTFMVVVALAVTQVTSVELTGTDTLAVYPSPLKVCATARENNVPLRSHVGRSKYVKVATPIIREVFCGTSFEKLGEGDVGAGVVGEVVGAFDVGDALGTFVGICDGAPVGAPGATDGTPVGEWDGTPVGERDGTPVGALNGDCVGTPRARGADVGDLLGGVVGVWDGAALGEEEMGLIEGLLLCGDCDGAYVGNMVGAATGAPIGAEGARVPVGATVVPRVGILLTRTGAFMDVLAPLPSSPFVPFPQQ
jgi:hypothetical protein